MSTICQKHIKHIEAYCSDDCCLLCINCILYDGHKGHQFQGLEDSLKLEYQKYVGQSENAINNHTKAQSIMQYLQNLQQNAESEHCKQQTEISRFFNCLRSIVDEREGKLQEQLNNQLQQQKIQIQQHLNKIEQNAIDLEQYLNNLEQLQNQTKDSIQFLTQSQNRNQLLNKLPINIVKPEISIKYQELNKETETNLIIKTLLSTKQQKMQVKSTPQPPQKRTVKDSIKKPMQQSKKIPLSEMVPNAVQINLKRKIEESKQPVRLTNFQEVRNQHKERVYDRSQERRRDQSTPRRLFKNQSRQIQEQQSPFNQNHKSATDIELHDDSMKQEFHTFLNSVQDFDPDYSNLNMSLDYCYITVGGFVDHLKQLVEKYDLKHDIAVEKDSLRSNRCKFGLAHLLNGHVLLMGGKQDGVRLNTCEEYNFKDKKIIPSKIQLPQQRSGFGTLNINQYIYIIGGHNEEEILKDFDQFNQIENTWNKLPQMNETRDELAVCIYDQIIFAIGGFGGILNICLKTVEVFQSNKWTPCAPLNIPRRALAAVALPDGIYAIGGFDGTQYLNSVEKYEDGRWTLIQSLNHPRCTLSALSTPDNQFIYVFGGFNNGPLDSVEKYSVLSGSWEQTNSLIARRFMHQTFLCLG